MAYIPGRRSYKRSPWHFCDQCGIKTDTGEMSRQVGFLICRRCRDKYVVGQREAMLARVIAQLPGNELQPIPKVTGENSNDLGFEPIEFGL